MIENRNILCIANPTWYGNYAKTIVELMKVFATKNNVLYVDYPNTVKDLAMGIIGSSDSPVRRMMGLDDRIRIAKGASNSELYVMTPPPVLSINFMQDGPAYRKLLKLNANIVVKAIKRALSKLDMEKDLIVINAFIPSVGLNAVGKFNESLLIYHCYDEISASQWVGNHGKVLEEEFMAQVDAVITTSQGLYDKKKRFNSNCYLVKNGVNISLFKKGLDLSGLGKKKVVGYIGSIDRRLDYELLRDLFTNMSDYKFVFVGRISDHYIELFLQSFANVEYLGPKPVEELPAIMKSFGAGIIPFVRNEFTQGIYPLKINEYLAAGLPVVSTDFSCLNDFLDIAQVEDNSASFMRSLREGIEQDSPQQRIARVRKANGNDWSSRISDISWIIHQLEESKATIS